MDIKSMRGMNDVLKPDVFAWQYAENLVRQHLESFGYSEIKTPILEMTSLFSRSVGENTDIVQKEMYTFADRNDESITMRPEGTAPVVRSVLQHKLTNEEPVQKLYYWGPMFRYERPQKGRYRQFYQYGFEVFGVESAKMDAEIIGMLSSLYEKFGLKDVAVELGSLGCESCRPLFIKELTKSLKAVAQDLCEDCQTRLEKNPLRVLDCKKPKCQELTAKAPGMVDHLCDPCENHFSEVKQGLDGLDVVFSINKKLVRGFDYYNRTVFEMTTTQLGSQNAIGGGGRYDKLVEQLGGKPCPAVGYAGGVERLILMLGDLERFKRPLDVFVVAADEAGREQAFLTAHGLRCSNIAVELDYTGKSMKSQMKKADKLEAQFVLIVGSAEVEKGTAVLRDMKTKNQEDVPLNDLTQVLMRKLSEKDA